MQEHQRQSMLKAMGLTVLQPRFVFAAAKPSAQVFSEAACFSPEPVENTATEPVTVAKESQDKAKLPEGGLKSIQDMIALSEAEQAPVSVRSVKRSTLRYRHRVIAGDAVVFVLDQPELEWQQAEKKLQFLQDIHQAVFLQTCSNWLQETFSWPVAGLDDSDAANTEQAFIEGVAQQRQARCVLIFSKAVASLLNCSNSLNGLPVEVCEPIEYYWKNPLAKAELWQQLQTVKRAVGV